MTKQYKILQMLEKIKEKIDSLNNKIHPDERWNTDDIPLKIKKLNQSLNEIEVANQKERSYARDNTINTVKPDFSWSSRDVPNYDKGEINKAEISENIDNKYIQEGFDFSMEKNSPDASWQWEDFPKNNFIIIKKENDLHENKSYDNFVEFGDSQAESPWEYYSITEDLESISSWKMAFEIAINLEDMPTISKAKKAADWILEYFDGNLKNISYKYIMEICEEGITFEELKSVLIVRNIWLGVFPDFLLPPYKWILKLVRNRADYPAEYVIDPNWVDEWHSYKKKYLSKFNNNNVYKLGALMKFISDKVDECVDMDLVNEIIAQITDAPSEGGIPLSKTMSEIRIYCYIYIYDYSVRDETAFLRTHWDWPYISMQELIKGVELPIYDWRDKQN